MKKITLILLIAVSFATLAEKLSYFYLAEKNGEFITKISISRQQYENMAADGWTFYGYDNKSEIPANPILDNGEVREMTTAELEAAANAAKLARTTFTKLEIREAFKALDMESTLNALLDNNAEFKTYWLDAIEIDLTHPVTIQALSNFSETEINNLKSVMQ